MLHPSESRVPFFAALCLFLSAIEYAIPKPLPFMRLGLANLPVLISFATMIKRDTVILITLKVFGQALISGTLFSYIFVFSAAGSFASGFAMLACYTLFHKTNHISHIGVSLAGALANNAAQIAVARLMIFGENTRYIAPILFAVGLVTALILGIFANVFCAKSTWYHNLLINNFEGKAFLSLQPGSLRGQENDVSLPAQLIVAMVLLPLFLLHQHIISFVLHSVSDVVRVCIAWTLVAIFFIMAAVKKRGKIKLLPSLFITLGITFFALFVPSGKILFSIGAFKITLDALLTGLRKSAILVGMVFLSQFAIDGHVRLPGKAGAFLCEMFAVFDALTSERLHFKKGRIIEMLDERLTALQN